MHIRVDQESLYGLLSDFVMHTVLLDELHQQAQHRNMCGENSSHEDRRVFVLFQKVEDGLDVVYDQVTHILTSRTHLAEEFSNELVALALRRVDLEQHQRYQVLLFEVAANFLQFGNFILRSFLKSLSEFFVEVLKALVWH